MCGLNGALRLTASAPALQLDELRATRDAQAARGPDGVGEWFSPDGLLALGHRRLAIIDLSPAAAQPMHSADGRFTLVFNGEIYNHAELRAELRTAGVTLRTESDSEVLLALLARHGQAAFGRLTGMYACALWDARERRLWLARDPFGIKPLYFAVLRDTLLFASQARALESSLARMGAAPALDPAGLAGFLLWGAVPEPFTLHRAIRALPAGHLLEVRDGALSTPRRHTDWDRVDLAPDADLGQALLGSVQAHLVSDRPVGVFLSAGLDSALVLAMVRRAQASPPRTFTLAFDAFRGTALDEAPLAAEVARQLGAVHTEVSLGTHALEDAWPQALAAMDLPSIDGFNSYLVSRCAREAGVAVALSGLGGDELFGGYPSFHDVPAWHRGARRLARVPGLRLAWPLLARGLTPQRPKLAGLLRHATTFAGAYLLRRALFLPEELPALLGPALARDALATYDATAHAQALLDDDGAWGARTERGPWAAVQHLETSLYLRQQLLRDADWASMAHGLELRVPLVDPRLAQATARAHARAPWRDKAALVRGLCPELPERLWGRPKSGFMVPDVSAAGGAPWGLAARHRARLVLRHFGIELEPPARPRGGTLLLLTECFARPGGIQRYNRDQVQALRTCRPEEALSALVLNDTRAQVQCPEWRGLRAAGFAGRRVRFAAAALVQVGRQRPRRIVFGHRHLLPLAPLVALAAPGSARWLLAYGVEMQAPLSWRERLYARALTRACAISPHTAALLDAAGLRRPAELWPCSLPFDWPWPAAAPPRLSRPLALLSVARLEPADAYKGLDDVLHALARLPELGVDAGLDIVGDGADRARLETLAERLGLAARVRFHGRLDGAALRARYAACDAFVLPSGAEGFGIVYLEALAYAKPVIAANAGGTPFVIRDGDTGFLVPFRDVEALTRAVAALATRPEAARRVGLAGRDEALRRFSFEAFTQRTAQLLAGERS
jgi:asparagine synthase (glutamine-hydrolysing)